MGCGSKELMAGAGSTCDNTVWKVVHCRSKLRRRMNAKETSEVNRVRYER